MTEIKTDICIIGAGSAGLVVAAVAAQLDVPTVLIEKHRMGGDCLNTGCVPSKSLLAAALVAQGHRLGKGFGITPREPDIDFATVNRHIKDIIAGIEPHDSQARFEGLGVHVVKGAAQFTGPDRVAVDGRTIRARRFVIATGSRAAVPPVAGIESVPFLTNETLFELTEKPEHLIIIGGGPVGMEMAQAHRRLGCAVTVLDRASILPKDDPELVNILRQSLAGEGVDIREGVEIERVSGNITVTLAGGEEIKGSHLLVAAGRAPNVEGLGLEEAGVKYDKHGIQTDKRLRTSNKKVFAAGDVAGGPQFTHIGGYHAGIVIQNALLRVPAKINYSALPWVTYCDPELANVGLTEAEARKKYGDKVRTTSWDFAENDRARAERRTEGKIKVTLLKNGHILGAAIVGPHAGELLQPWGLAIANGLKIKAMSNLIMPYPTFSEVSKRAAGDYFREALFSEKTKKLVNFLRKFG